MKLLLLTFLLWISIVASAQVRPAVSQLPESSIDIPVTIALKPIFAMAEKMVDTVFTSPNYPSSWVYASCDTRYRYRFRRSPFQMSMQGTTLKLGFTGRYALSGATRSCVKGIAITPWSPSCDCGIDESERRVQIGFTSTFNLRPDYILQSTIVRGEPVAIDKCEVCFWGQDITPVVMDGIKAELDLSRKEMEKSYGQFNLRPYVMQAWNLLNTVYALPQVGYFALNPKKLRMNKLNASNDLLQINIGVSATPVVSFTQLPAASNPLPNLSATTNPGGFNIFLEAALQYDSLSGIMNSYLRGKRFDISEGLFKRHITIDSAAVRGDGKGHLLIAVKFSGSFDGTVNFIGKPSYNEANKTIEVQELDYELTTKNFLLKTAKWLFNNRIISELKKYAVIDLSSYYGTASQTLHTWLNREWAKGVKGTGSVKELKLLSIDANPDQLLIRSNCSGQLAVQISELSF